LTRRGVLRSLVGAALLFFAAPTAHAANPDGLWKLVHEHCVPNQEQHGQPAPCALVDLHDGVPQGYALLKDLVGATQYLVIPTARITGIEDPALLHADTPNYFADAWRERSYTEHAAGRALARDMLSLAVNSPFARSQNQLHIHIDCLLPNVRDALRRQAAAVGDQWAPLAEPLAGHRYWAMRMLGDDLGGADPFRLLAEGKPGARAAMGRQTLVVAGAEFADGRPGFLLLDDQADLAARDPAGGEELQDHSCALARR
jgi:CDP-diacylglycerol pyrophosphatase